jgi:hypothetical protein
VALHAFEDVVLHSLCVQKRSCTSITTPRLASARCP